MAAYIRKIRTKSGATAVQIAQKDGRRDQVLEHLGSAHTDSELAALVQAASDKLHAGQQSLDLEFSATRPDPHESVVTAKRSRHLIDTIEYAWRNLGFDDIDDDALFQLVLARIVEPTSMRDSARVVGELGLHPAHRNTYAAALRRCARHGYRDTIADRCFEYAAATGGLALLLYDVTTLYFEAENEDDLWKVGYSKERRVDPQIVVGLLVDRSGFPLEIGCYEGNYAETRTIVPIIRQFQARHGIEGAEMIIAADAGMLSAGNLASFDEAGLKFIAADAGMLSAGNLASFDEAGLKFIVGSRTVKAPGDLASHFHWHGDVFTDGQIIDTVTPRNARWEVNSTKHRNEPVWGPDNDKAWRAVWHYSSSRARRDNKTLTAQENKARDVIDGRKTAKAPRFVKATKKGRSLDEAALARARRLVGLKGYVTNVPVQVMGPSEVLKKYHDLWHVEQSFRMSKTDLRARPIFHHKREAIEAHLTVVFGALAISRYLQQATGVSIRHLVRTLRPIQDITVRIAGHLHTATDPLSIDAADILTTLEAEPN